VSAAGRSSTDKWEQVTAVSEEEQEQREREQEQVKGAGEWSRRTTITATWASEQGGDQVSLHLLAITVTWYVTIAIDPQYPAITMRSARHVD